MIGVGDTYGGWEVKVKNYVQHLSQTSAVIKTLLYWRSLPYRFATFS